MVQGVPKQPRREDVRPEELAAYDRVVGRQTAYGYSKGTPGYTVRPKGREAGDYFGALLQSPWIADHLSELGVIYRTRGEFPGSYAHRDREWVDIIVSRHVGLNTIGHITDAISVGVRPEAIIAVTSGDEASLTAEERESAAYIRVFMTGQVTDAQWQAVVDRLGVRGAIEYTALIGHIYMTFRMMQVVWNDPLPSDADAIAYVRRVVAGEVPLPDPKARIPSLEYKAPAEPEPARP